MKFVLRTTPNYSIHLFEKHLTIQNDHRKRYNGDYEYSCILDVSLRPERTNYFTLVISLVVDLIFSQGFVGIYKDKTVFEVRTNARTIKIHASDFNEFQTKKCVREIRRRIKQINLS